MKENTWLIPPWIASRSYFVGTDKSRTIITNSLWFTNLILEDTSSDLWSILPRKFRWDTLRCLLPTVNIDPNDEDNQTAIRDFLKTLHAEGTVQIEESENPQPVRAISKNKEEHNINVSKAADFKARLTEAGLLSTGFVELTYCCNEKCVHCFNPRIQYDSSTDLTTSEVIKVINDLYTAGIYDIAFSGGEPSLRNDLFEILDETRRLNLAITLFTNGQLPEEKLQRIITYHPRTVGVSIYSANPNIHDATTQVKGSWEKSIRTIKILVAAGIRVVMKCPLMQHTVHGYQEFLKLCDDLGTVPQCDIHISPTFDGNQTVCCHQVTDSNALLKVFCDTRLPLMPDVNEPDSDRPKRSVNNPACGAGVSHLSISPDGMVYVCNNLPFPLGNIREKSIAELRKSPVLASIRAAVLDDFDECGMYSECTYCDTCPGVAMLETGNFFGKAKSRCLTARARQEVAKLLELTRVPIADFGHDLTFREPQTVFTDELIPSPELVNINIDGDDFVAQLKQIKANGNPVRKTIIPEPDSLAALSH